MTYDAAMKRHLCPHCPPYERTGGNAPVIPRSFSGVPDCNKEMEKLDCCNGGETWIKWNELFTTFGHTQPDHRQNQKGVCTRYYRWMIYYALPYERLDRAM